MSNYKAPDTEFQAVANAIRTKGGTQAQLEWPTEFISAIQNIPSSGGGSSGIHVGTGDPTSSLGNDGDYYYKRIKQRWVIDEEKYKPISEYSSTNTRIYGGEFFANIDFAVLSVRMACKADHTGSIRIGNMTDIYETVNGITFPKDQFVTANFSQPIQISKNERFIIQALIDGNSNGDIAFSSNSSDNFSNDTNVLSIVKARYGSSYPGSSEPTFPLCNILIVTPQYFVNEEYIKNGVWIKL